MAPRAFGSRGLSRWLRRGVGEARVAIVLRDDPLDRAARSSSVRFALQGRLTQGEVSALRGGGPAVQRRVVAHQQAERRAALDGLSSNAEAVHRPQAPVIHAVIRAGGSIISTQAIGNRIIATVPFDALARLAARSDVASITPAPVERSMGLDTETAAMGAPSFWSAGFSGSDVAANNGVGVNLAIQSDKIQEDHPAFAGINFERPAGTGTGTICGATDGATSCDHGTAVASFAISRGASGCSQCVAPDADQKGIAPGLDHVLDNSTDGTGYAYDNAAWPLGITDTVWDNSTQSWHTIPGAPYPAEIASDSHGSYTTADDSTEGQAADLFVSQYGLTYTEPSGNDGQNGDGSGHITDSCLAYDVICVGAVDYHGTTDASDDTVASWSSQGPSPAGREKPDLVANGQPTGYARRDWWNGLWQSNTWGTSYASPQVAGGAALLYSSGVTDPLAIKAVLLDSARQGRAPGCTPSPCAMGTQAGWQRDWGWGELDLTDALAQRTNFAEGALPGGSVRFYSATPESTGDRATLVWNRRASGCVDPGCTTTAYTLSNLDLKQLDPTTCAVQTSSASAIDNVEQVRAPAGSSGQQVLYDVEANSGVDGLPAEPFALATTRALTPLASPAADVTLATSVAEPQVGQDVEVDATVTNSSPDLTADSTSVTLDLPAGTDLVSGPVTQAVGQLAHGGQPGDRAGVSWVVRATTAGTHRLTATTDAEHCREHFTAQGTAEFATVTAPPPGGTGNQTGPPGSAPPAPTPAPGLPAPKSPFLRVAKPRPTSRGLLVTGTLARAATGHVTVMYTTGRAHHRRRFRKVVRVRRGRFTALLRVPRALRRVRPTLVVTYSGDAHFRAETRHIRGQ
jgi:hypothetical protein